MSPEYARGCGARAPHPKVRLPIMKLIERNESSFLSNFMGELSTTPICHISFNRFVNFQTRGNETPKTLKYFKEYAATPCKKSYFTLLNVEIVIEK